MKKLKYQSLLLIKNDNKIITDFQNYFDKIKIINNNETISINEKEYYPILFIVDDIQLIKEIRKYDKDTIIILIVSKITKDILMKAIKLRIFDLLEFPFNRDKLENLLERLEEEIDNLYKKKNYWINEGYFFDFNKKILYDTYRNEVKLTKKELELLKILLKSKGQFIPSETIEYELWENDSKNSDCNQRLKTLINGLRKKLPPKTILNSYGLGYKII